MRKLYVKTGSSRAAMTETEDSICHHPLLLSFQEWIVVSSYTPLSKILVFIVNQKILIALQIKHVFFAVQRLEQSSSKRLTAGQKSGVIPSFSPLQFICHHTAVCHDHPEAAG